MIYSQFEKECKEDIDLYINKYVDARELYKKILEKYNDYLNKKNPVKHSKSFKYKVDVTRFKSIYLSYHGEQENEAFTKTLDIRMQTNLGNWLEGTVVPQKENIIKLVLLLIDFSKKEIDYVAFCNSLLKAFGHDALHSRNMEEAFAVFCMQNKNGYEFYISKIDLLHKYIKNIPALVSFDAKALFSIKNAIVAIDVSVVKAENLKGKVEELKVLFQNMTFSTIEKPEGFSQLEDIEKIAKEILEEKESDAAKASYKDLSPDDKKKYKAIIENIRNIGAIIEKLYDTSLQDVREKITETSYDVELEAYTTQFFSSEQEELKSFVEFENYLHEYGKYFTKRRNKTIKNLMDALYIKYLKENKKRKISFRKIGIDYENFFFSTGETDKSNNLITLNAARANKNKEEKANWEYCAYDTDRSLAKMLSGQKDITRSTYVSWLMFSGLSLVDIDDYLEQSGFMTISGNEKDLLSELVEFAYFLKGEFNYELNKILIDLYKCFLKDVPFEFPLYSYH